MKGSSCYKHSVAIIGSQAKLELPLTQNDQPSSSSPYSSSSSTAWPFATQLMSPSKSSIILPNTLRPKLKGLQKEGKLAGWSKQHSWFKTMQHMQNTRVTNHVHSNRPSRLRLIVQQHKMDTSDGDSPSEGTPISNYRSNLFPPFLFYSTLLYAMLFFSVKFYPFCAAAEAFAIGHWPYLLPG